MFLYAGREYQSMSAITVYTGTVRCQRPGVSICPSSLHSEIYLNVNIETDNHFFLLNSAFLYRSGMSLTMVELPEK